MLKFIKDSTVCKILIGIVILTLAFIFVQSTLPQETSGAQSDAVGGFLDAILPDSPFKDFLIDDVRKVAHFVEFAVLSSELMALNLVYILKNEEKEKRTSSKVKNHLSLLAFGMFVALVDETIQVFSKRGPRVPDIWIDMFGFISALAAFLIVQTLVFAIKKKKKQ